MGSTTRAGAIRKNPANTVPTESSANAGRSPRSVCLYGEGSHPAARLPPYFAGATTAFEPLLSAIWPPESEHELLEFRVQEIGAEVVLLHFPERPVGRPPMASHPINRRHHPRPVAASHAVDYTG